VLTCLLNSVSKKAKQESSYEQAIADIAIKSLFTTEEIE